MSQKIIDIRTRNKKQTALTTIIIIIWNMQQDIGIVNKEDIFDGLMEKHGIGREEATNLLTSLKNRGIIYSPRPGFYRIAS